MLRIPTPRILALGAAVLALSACDATGPDDLSDADLDDAAAIVASALALDGGGVLEDAAAGASLAAAASGTGRSAGPDRPGCDHDRSYDEAAALWTVTTDCERGDPNGPFYAAFARTATYQFLDADGAAQRGREGAAGIEYDVLSGTSRFQAPRGVHALTSLGADLSIRALDDDLASVSGTYERAATDTLRGARGERTIAYTLALTLDDVQGPKSRVRRWRTAVAGTITGSLQATITRTPAGGETSTVDVDREFTVTFSDAGAERVAEIRIGGRRYRADVDTGEVAGV